MTRHEPETQIRDFLAPYAPHIQATALRLRDLVLEMVPGAMEQVDHPAKLLAYGWRQTCRATLCVIMPLKAAVNLGFPRGVDLPDPAGLLTGTGKRARHTKMASIQEAERPELRALLAAAVAQVTPPSGPGQHAATGEVQ